MLSQSRDVQYGYCVGCHGVGSVGWLGWREGGGILWAGWGGGGVVVGLWWSYPGEGGVGRGRGTMALVGMRWGGKSP